MKMPDYGQRSTTSTERTKTKAAFGRVLYILAAIGAALLSGIFDIAGNGERNTCRLAYVFTPPPVAKAAKRLSRTRT